MEYAEVLQAHQQLFPGADLSRPEAVEAFNKWWGQIEKLPPGVWQATFEVLSKPDQKVAFVRDYGGDLDRWLESVVSWWSANGHNAAGNINEYAPEMKLLDSLGYQVNPEALPGVGTLDPNNPNAVPLEQSLLDTTLRNYINPDIAGDPARRATAEDYVGRINRSLDDAIGVNNEVLTGTFDGNGYLTRNPDVAEWAAAQVAGGQYPDLATAARAHYELFGRDEGRTATNVTRLQQENQMADDTTGRLARAAEEAANTRLGALDQRRAEMTSALDQLQRERTGALDTMSAERRTALDAQTAQLRAGLATLETERRAALQELTGARIAAAQSQVTGINQGLQFERDRITARNAEQGFIGGGGMEDAALARATIGARQGAAEAMGGARVANAGDSRALGDEIANTRFGITGNDATARRGIAEDTARGRYGITDDTARGRFSLADSLSASRVGVQDRLAGERQGAADTGTRMRLGYFDNDFSRRLQAALLPVTLNSQRLSLLDTADRAGQAGLNRSLNTLNWWATGNNPPSSNPALTTPSTVGSDIAGLGAGLTRSAFNIGNTVGWDRLFSRPPATTPPANSPQPPAGFRWSDGL